LGVKGLSTIQEIQLKLFLVSELTLYKQCPQQNKNYDTYNYKTLSNNKTR
jgi:hypothetical protein